MSAWHSFVKWNQFDPDKHPCIGDADPLPCCSHFGQFLAKHLEVVLKIMRFSRPQAMPTDITNPAHFLNAGYNASKSNSLVMIPVCTVNSFEVKDRKNRCKNSAFKAVLTDMGLCLATNSLAMKKIFKKTPYIQSFQRVTDPNGIDTEDVDSPPNVFSTTNLVLDSMIMSRPKPVRDDMDQPSWFYLSLGNKWTPFDVRTKWIRVSAGYQTSIKIVPTSISASPWLRDLDPEERNCKFMDESHDLEIFEVYTQAGCHFECWLRESRKVCGCTPWNYPHPPGEVKDLCDMAGNSCFEKIMENSTTMNCHCLKVNSNKSY